MFTLLAIVWFIWELKYILFWLYLWQLKEYHVGRFLDHFRTFKGKKLIFSFEQIFKLFLFIFLAVASFFSGLFLALAIILYVIESAIFIRALLNRNAKKPAWTFKTRFLTGISFAASLSFLYWVFTFEEILQLKWFLAFDILTPIIISVIVLVFQPFFVIGRNNVLKKAKIKLEKIKKLNNLTVIAITGSYGKTSTKEFLATILSKKFKVLSTSKHQNSEIGVANSILNDLNTEHQIFIAEVGAYNKGKVKEVCEMLKPRIGIVTGVNEQHLSLFGSMENLLSAEGGEELADVLPEDGMLVVNGENKYCLDLYKKTETKNKKIYSLNNKKINSDVWSDQITIYKDYISFLALDKSGQAAHFNVKVLGAQNVQNLLGAILIAKELGMSMGEISEACKNIKQEQAGMTLHQDKNGIYVVDSSYSANPDGVYADLDYFNTFAQKKVIIMPCLIELGKKSDEIHRKIGRKIAKICNLAIITSQDKFLEIKSGAVEAGMDENNVVLCDKSEDIYSIVNLFCKSGDAVLLEGRVPKELINLLK